MKLAEILDEISTWTKPPWAAFGQVELSRRNNGAWVCHAGDFMSSANNPLDAALMVLENIKKGHGK